MTAKDLIAALSELPPDVKVMIWVDGDRHEISPSLPVDLWEYRDGRPALADVNAKPDRAKD